VFILLPAQARASSLLRVAKELNNHERLDLFAAMESLDTGRSMEETEHDVRSAAEAFEWMAAQAMTMSDQRMQIKGGDTATVLREPLGVCVGIGAWYV
jgi:betaine-aldehyde dehydrogenase